MGIVTTNIVINNNMRNLLNLRESDNKIAGNAISFIDIDETTFHTYAKVGVYKDGKKIKDLTNQEFNTYELKPGESFNFDEFQDSEVFHNTSKPIKEMVKKIKKLIDCIKLHGKPEKVIFLTARSDFDNKEVFLKTFRENGIDVDIPNVHVERSGNLKHISSVADRKKYIIIKYLKSGEYSAVRMYDDDEANLETFLQLGVEINTGKYNILKKVQAKYPRTKNILFFPLKVTNTGKAVMLKENKEILTERIFPDIPEDVYNKILYLTSNNDKPNSYTKWLCTLYKNDKLGTRFTKEDNGGIIDIEDDIKYHAKLVRAGKAKEGIIKPIIEYNSVEELENDLENVIQSGYKSKKEYNDIAAKGMIKVLTVGDFNIYRVKNKEAAMKYGKGTRWCTTTRNNDMSFKRLTYITDMSKPNDKSRTFHGSVLLYAIGKNDEKYGIAASFIDKADDDFKSYVFRIYDKKDNLVGRLDVTNRDYGKDTINTNVFTSEIAEKIVFALYKNIKLVIKRIINLNEGLKDDSTDMDLFSYNNVDDKSNTVKPKENNKEVSKDTNEYINRINRASIKEKVKEFSKLTSIMYSKINENINSSVDNDSLKEFIYNFDFLNNISEIYDCSIKEFTNPGVILKKYARVEKINNLFQEYKYIKTLNELTLTRIINNVKFLRMEDWILMICGNENKEDSKVKKQVRILATDYFYRFIKEHRGMDNQQVYDYENYDSLKDEVLDIIVDNLKIFLKQCKNILNNNLKDGYLDPEKCRSVSKEISQCFLENEIYHNTDYMEEVWKLFHRNNTNNTNNTNNKNAKNIEDVNYFKSIKANKGAEPVLFVK